MYGGIGERGLEPRTPWSPRLESSGLEQDIRPNAGAFACLAVHFAMEI